MSRFKKIARRTFLIGSAAVAGGVVFGYYKYNKPYANPLLQRLNDGQTALNPYVKIDQSGITIITPRAEMGQGVHTTLAALVAEELDVTLDQITTEHGPASKAYFNGAGFEEAVPFRSTDHGWMANKARAFTHVPAKFLGMQMTGGSSTTVDAYEKMRLAGATARAVLVEAAAAELNVAVGTLKTRSGAVISADGRQLPYTRLAAKAASIEPPASVPLKPKSNWTILGKSQPRVDAVGKSTGTAEYAIDVRLPGMLYASVKTNPHLGGRMIGFDSTRAEKMPGVQKIIELEDGVAVVATNTWYAFQAVNSIRFEWGPADYPTDSAAIFNVLENSFTSEREDSQFRNEGEVELALDSDQSITAEYKAPFLAHATMEPMNATALVKNGWLEVWAGNQSPTQVLAVGEEITGFDRDNIDVHSMLMGGAFGRRVEMDFIKQAIHIAKGVSGTPVKLTWTREEDTTHDTYRPAALARFRGAVKDGLPTALDLQVSSLSVLASQMGRIGMPAAGADVTLVQAAWDQPYGIPNYRVTGYRAPVSVPVGAWRSVGASQNGFFHESALDELAHKASKDPLQMRLELMTYEPGRLVLEAVAELSDWGAALPDGHALGVAFVMSFGVPVAEVIEVANTPSGIKIVNVWAAVDVGTALDPRNVEAQVESGINFGLTAAIMGDITIKDGRVEQTNFHNYGAIRMNQAPSIKVRVLENQAHIRGIGEPGTPPAAPALANAIFAATGQRIRELPLKKHIRFV
ncbi:MAG: molybdopterin cofactor-binding domain-containing protein [Gammaproteobacteria bacterium]